MVEEKLIWNRIKIRAEAEIKDYEDAIFISQHMLELSESKLKLISGQMFLSSSEGV